MWFLGAAQRLHALPGLGAALIDIFGNRGRADEAHRLDIGMVENAVDHFLVAMDDVENAFRQAGLHEEVPGQHGGGSVALGGLEDEAVAAGNGCRIHPHRHHGREVERSDAGDDAERLAIGIGVDRGADIAGKFALEQLGNAAGIIDAVDAAGDFTQSIVMHLAVLARNLAGQVIGILVEQSLELEHDAGALHRGRIAPGDLRLLGGSDGFVQLGHGRKRQFGRLLAGGRIEDRDAARRGRNIALAGNGILDNGHQSMLLKTLRRASISSAIWSLLTISGGLSAMMSPVVRIR